jgi:hypothetical protein
LADAKILAHPKSLADVKTRGHPKSLADAKNLAHPKSLAPTEMLAHRKNYAPANVGAAGKVGGFAEELPYCLSSAEFATAYSSQAPLLVSFSSLLIC